MKENKDLEEIGKQLNIPKSQIITVSQVSDYLSKKLSQDDFLSNIHILSRINY